MIFSQKPLHTFSDHALNQTLFDFQPCTNMRLTDTDS